MFRSNVAPTDLPDGWQARQLGSFAVVRAGGRLKLNKSHYQPFGVEAFSAAGQDGYVNIAEDDHPAIVLASIGSCGRCYATKGPWTTLANTQVIVPDPDVADQSYLHAFLDNPAYWSISGSAQPFIKPSDVKGAWVALPQLDEQRRIAEVLRSVDDAVAANQSAIDAARRIVRQVADDIAANAVETTPIKRLGEVVTGRTPAPSNEDFWNGDLPFVTPGDIDAGAISVNHTARRLNSSAAHGGKLIPAGSLLVTCIGSTVGKMALTHCEVSTNQQINAVICPRNLSGYVYVACLSILDDILANAGRQAVPIINKTTFSSLQIPLLSPEAMMEVSATVLALDDEITAAQDAISQLREVKARISSDLLSGRVRVPA